MPNLSTRYRRSSVQQTLDIARSRFFDLLTQKVVSHSPALSPDRTVVWKLTAHQNTLAKVLQTKVRVERAVERCGSEEVGTHEKTADEVNEKKDRHLRRREIREKIEREGEERKKCMRRFM